MSFKEKYGKPIRIDKEVKKIVVEHSQKTGLSIKKSAETLIKKGHKILEKENIKLFFNKGDIVICAIDGPVLGDIYTVLDDSEKGLVLLSHQSKTQSIVENRADYYLLKKGAETT